MNPAIRNKMLTEAKLKVNHSGQDFSSFFAVFRAGIRIPAGAAFSACKSGKLPHKLPPLGRMAQSGNSRAGILSIDQRG
jgi:hypothetical protein